MPKGGDGMVVDGQEVVVHGLRAVDCINIDGAIRAQRHVVVAQFAASVEGPHGLGARCVVYDLLAGVVGVDDVVASAGVNDDAASAGGGQSGSAAGMRASRRSILGNQGSNGAGHRAMFCGVAPGQRASTRKPLALTQMLSIKPTLKG